MALDSPSVDTYVARDGRRLAVRVWSAGDAPWARAVFLHGIISHGGWYERSAAHLALAGCEAHYLDRRGAGLNREARGDVDRWETWLDDVEVYLGQLGKQVPLALMGISWGGKLAAAVARRRPELLDGLGLLCPGIYAYQQPGPLRRAALWLARPRWLADRTVPIPLADPALFTGTADWQEFIRHDADTLRRITLRFARNDQILTRYARQAPPHLRLPTLLMLAGADPIVDNRRMIDYFQRIAATDKQLVEYTEATHTLEFEPDPSRYCDDLLAWTRHVANVAS